MVSFERLASMVVLSIILGAATVPLTMLVAQSNPVIAFAGVSLGMLAVQVCCPDLIR